MKKLIIGIIFICFASTCFSSSVTDVKNSKLLVLINQLLDQTNESIYPFNQAPKNRLTNSSFFTNFLYYLKSKISFLRREFYTIEPQNIDQIRQTIKDINDRITSITDSGSMRLESKNPTNLLDKILEKRLNNLQKKDYEELQTLLNELELIKYNVTENINSLEHTINNYFSAERYKWKSIIHKESQSKYRQKFLKRKRQQLEDKIEKFMDNHESTIENALKAAVLCAGGFFTLKLSKSIAERISNASTSILSQAAIQFTREAASINC